MKNHSERNESSSFARKDNTVDVTKLYNGAVSEVCLDFVLDTEEDGVSDYVYAEKPKVKAKVYRSAEGRDGAESYVSLDIEIEGQYTCLCARCAKELTKTLTIKDSFGVTRGSTEDCEEYVEAPDGLLDVGEAARTLFYLEQPTRVLCKEDCQGLCPVCGADLNKGTCSCKPVQKGNRLEGLKKLLDNSDN